MRKVALLLCLVAVACWAAAPFPVAFFKGSAVGGGATLLLDESGLGSAAFSISTGKVRAAYSGDVLRVRRSSDNAECDVEFLNDWVSLNSPINNLSAGSGATLTAWAGSDSCYVVTWFDQSGNARNASQSTAANQPMIMSGGALLTGANGRACVRFDGSNDRMATAGGLSISQPQTGLVVYNALTWTVGDRILDGASNNRIGMMQSTTTPQIEILAGVNGQRVSPALTTWVAVSCVWLTGANNSKLRLNDGADVLGNVGSNGVMDGVTIADLGGGGSYGHIEVSEVVVWPSEISSSNRTNAFNNVDVRYAIP